MMGGTAVAGAMGPGWLAGAFAAVMIATAVYCAGRIIAARRWRRPTGYDIDAVHVLMGTAMAGMLVPGLRFGPAGGWEMVFGAAAGWFGWRAWRGRGPAGHGPAQHRPAQHGAAQHVQHLLASLAMLYMLLAVGPAPSGAAATAMGGSTHLRTLALVLALALLGCVINSADRLTALPLAAGTAAARAAPPAMAAGPAGPAGPGGPGWPRPARHPRQPSGRRGHRPHPGPVPAAGGLLRHRHGCHHGLPAGADDQLIAAGDQPGSRAARRAERRTLPASSRSG